MTTRRRFLVTLASVFGLLVRGRGGEKVVSAGTCELTSEAIEGPYYIDDVFVRKAVAEGREGFPLTLKIKLLSKDRCEPVSGALVDIWHCDALGNYSGYPNADPDEFPNVRGHVDPDGDLRFCRGRQITDVNGEVEFETIFPGWYTPRTVHIHIKAILGNEEMITTQMYFPQDLNDRILSREKPYDARGKSPYRNDGDMLIRRARRGKVAFPKVEEKSNRIVATQRIVVSRGLA